MTVIGRYTPILLIVLIPAAALSQEHMTGTRAMGMGEAFTAGASGNGAVYHNPAGLSSAMMFSLEGAYAHDTSRELNIANVSVVDSKTNPNLAAGLAFTWETASPDNQPDYEAYHFRVGFSMPIAERFMIGLAGRYMNITVGSDEIADDFTLDVGTLFRISDEFIIGVVGYNVVNSGLDQLAPISLGAGAAFTYGYVFQIAAEIRFDFTSDADTVPKRYHAGAEYLIGGVVPIRLGYQYDEAIDSHFLTVGAGFRESTIGIDACYKQNLNDKNDQIFSISLNLYL